jgi:hypothetical protein
LNFLKLIKLLSVFESPKRNIPNIERQSDSINRLPMMQPVPHSVRAIFNKRAKWTYYIHLPGLSGFLTGFLIFHSAVSQAAQMPACNPLSPFLLGSVF